MGCLRVIAIQLANYASAQQTAYVFFSSLIVLNAALLIATSYRVLGPAPSVVYTYLDKDIPLDLPVGPVSDVEMTFQESSRFGFDEDSKLNWETLFTNQFGLGFSHLGPYHFRYIGGAYHSLHCMYSMALDFDAPHHLTHPSHHFVHCLNYLRQLFLCNSDHFLEEGDFMGRNLTIDRMGDTRKCRDWSQVAAWIDQNFKEWSDYNEISFD